MCDYSLHSFATRLAEEGEQLCVYQFPTGSKGLVAAHEFPTRYTGFAATFRDRFWTAISSLFKPEPSAPLCAVCVPPGAKLLLTDIAPTMQRRFGISPREEVVFTQLSAAPYQYRDAVRFDNGRQLLLQQLEEGLRVEVRTVALTEEEEFEVREQQRFVAEMELAFNR
jgi:hypothetical protein